MRARIDLLELDISSGRDMCLGNVSDLVALGDAQGRTGPRNILYLFCRDRRPFLRKSGFFVQCEHRISSGRAKVFELSFVYCSLSGTYWLP